MKKILKHLILFLIGGGIYFFIENLYRGYSHPSMFAVGGISFLIIGLLNEFYTFQMPILIQMFLSAVIITTLEFLSGVILNIWLRYDIWDYSDLCFNFLGQISLYYSTLWFFISLPAILADDYLRYLLFKEEKPHYKIY